MGGAVPSGTDPPHPRPPPPVGRGFLKNYLSGSVRKGNKFSIGSKAVALDDLDYYFQEFRCAVIDFLKQDRKEVVAAA